jgi:nucleoid-associated protein YgaU
MDAMSSQDEIAGAAKPVAKRASAVKVKLDDLKARLGQDELAEAAEAAKTAAAAKAVEAVEQAAPQFLAEHTVEAGETLSHIALKYYKNANKPFYMAIYEANKATIGDNPNRIKPGMLLHIPVLPEDFK